MKKKKVGHGRKTHRPHLPQEATRPEGNKEKKILPCVTEKKWARNLKKKNKLGALVMHCKALPKKKEPEEIMKAHKKEMGCFSGEGGESVKAKNSHHGVHTGKGKGNDQPKTTSGDHIALCRKKRREKQQQRRGGRKEREGEGMDRGAKGRKLCAPGEKKVHRSWVGARQVSWQIRRNKKRKKGNCWRPVPKGVVQLWKGENRRALPDHDEKDVSGGKPTNREKKRGKMSGGRGEEGGDGPAKGRPRAQADVVGKI